MSSIPALRRTVDKAGLARKLILVVEDHNDARLMLSIALDKMGLDVMTVTGGAAALMMVREHKPDLLLLDIKLADSMHGLTVCERVKSDAHSRSTGVIIMSGRSDQFSIEEAKRVGADAFLVKPFRLSDLLELVTAEPFQTDVFTLVPAQ